MNTKCTEQLVKADTYISRLIFQYKLTENTAKNLAGFNFEYKCQLLKDIHSKLKEHYNDYDRYCFWDIKFIHDRYERFVSPKEYLNNTNVANITTALEMLLDKIYEKWDAESRVDLN